MVDKGEIKVDKDGNITDKNGKKVEVKDGKVEVKTDDGKTVTVKVNDVKTTVSNNNNGNKGNTEKKEDTNSNTSGNNQKPAKPSNSSNNNQTPAKPNNSSNNNNKPATNTKATEAPKYKYYKHHDAVTKHHDREWIVTGTHEEPVYKTRWVNICNNCGVELEDANFRREHLTWELKTNGAGAYHAEERQVQVGTKTVEDGYWKEAYTETITPAYDEEVSENDHWDKKVPIN